MKILLTFLVLSGFTLAVDTMEGKAFLTAENSSFGNTIEGTGVDSAGDVYAVDFGNDITSAGRITGEQALLYKSDNASSLVSSMRFFVNSEGKEEAFITDAMVHRVVRLYDRDSTTGQFASSADFCKDDAMLEPNDIAIAPTYGRIFLSGMKWSTESVSGDGDLWTCDSSGTAKLLGTFYRTNGIEVSPDEKTLYLSEAINKDDDPVSNVVLAFDLDAEAGTISNKRVFVDFAQLDNTATTDVDGMRTDTEGNLYITRNGLGQVAVFSPSGELIMYITSPSIKDVANLEFGGEGGKDLYMVGMCNSDETKGCVDVYSGSAVGNAFSKLQAGGSVPGTDNGVASSESPFSESPSSESPSSESPSSTSPSLSSESLSSESLSSESPSSESPSSESPSSESSSSSSESSSPPVSSAATRPTCKARAKQQR